LTVQDDGAGIDPAILDRIFEPFFTTKGVGEGTGMGLAVVHGVVRALEGDISVESKVGAGTTFRVYLPCADEEQTEADAGQELVSGGKGRILAVDDEPVLVDLVQQMMEQLGYDVVAALPARRRWRLFEPTRTASTW
jgi:hypothetical protein